METYTLYKFACLFFVGFMSLSFFKSLIYYIFGVYDIENHNNRLKQLNSTGERLKKDKKDENVEQTKELIKKVTAPIIRHVMPNVSYNKDLSGLEKSLRFAGADKYLNATQYTALILLGRVAGLLVFILLFPYNQILAIIWFFAPAILPTLLFKNTIANKKQAILLGFPEFINISKSYLVSGMPFEKAVEESIFYVNKEWQELLKQYLINSETYSKKECLTMLAEDCNSFEVKEFISIVKLNLEQGIDIKDSFDAQYEKTKAVQMLAIQKKIEARKIWAILVQGPVLITILVAFGLPIADSMMNFSGGL